MELQFRCFQDGDARENNLKENKIWKENIGKEIDLDMMEINKKGKEKKLTCKCTVKYVGDDGQVIVEIKDKKMAKRLRKVLP